MGLLEKALRDSSPEPSGAGHLSLYARAVAATASAVAARGDVAHVEALRRVPSAAPVESPPAEAPRPSSSLAFSFEDLASLESRLSGLSPTFDSYLAAWSAAASSLRLSSLALFMPRGDALFPVARIGFPPRPASPIPSNVALQARSGRDCLDDSASEILSNALGASPTLPFRAAAVLSGSRIAALWAYRDAALEAAPREMASRLGAALASVSGRGAPLLPILGVPSAVESMLIDSVLQSALASCFLYDLGSLNDEISASCPGVSPELIVSTFAAACSSILSGEGSASPCGDLRVGCALGSSSSSDHELALFQFGKSLRRLLPFLSVASFPSGRSISIEPSSNGAASALARFLAG